MKKILINIGQSLLGGLGLVKVVIEVYNHCYVMPDATNVAQGSGMNFELVLMSTVLIGGIWFFVNGLWITGFLKRSIEITSNAITSTITIKFGDIFAQDGCIAVSVNEFFDSALDNKHVSLTSLHGLMLTKYWRDNIEDWDEQVKKELIDITPEDVDRTPPGKKDRYPLGTTVAVWKNGSTFLCVALAKTCIKSLEASATSDDLQHALRDLLTKARSTCSGQPLNIPLIGSGLARTGIKHNIIVDLILLAIFEESKIRPITDQIRIVLPKHMRKNIDLTTIQQDWK